MGVGDEVFTEADENSALFVGEWQGILIHHLKIIIKIIIFSLLIILVL